MAEAPKEPANVELTYGQKLVGLNFNPSNDPTVQDIKEKAAAFIDSLHTVPADRIDVSKQAFLKKAIEDAISAQMFGVKAATWNIKPKEDK